MKRLSDLRSHFFQNSILALVPLFVLATGPYSHAAKVAYVDDQGGLVPHERDDVDTSIAALAALANPPAYPAVQQPLFSAIPSGTQITALSMDSGTTTVSFSMEVLGSGLDESRLETIFRQVRATLAQFGNQDSIRLETGGKLLSDYLPPAAEIQPALPTSSSEPMVAAASATGNLSGKIISLSPGHGRYWNGTGWTTARPVYCSPLSQEDYHNLEIMNYLEIYLSQEGATTKSYRCFDKSYGNHSSGAAWWQMAASYWLKQNGYPCSVYADSTGDCTLGSGSSESSDDIRARPLASDYDNADIYISLHSNGYAGDCTGSCPTGTETYYDSSTEHAAWGAISQTLANNVNGAIMSAITANADSSWTCHGTCVKNSNGAYGEIRIPDRAAILTELAFHDSCDRDADASHLRDNFFRSTAMWGMYKGICTYFGTTPTWAYYSDELVSHDIPATMNAGATVTAHITFRNRGVLWANSRNFRLGAVGDSDPFSTTTRYSLSSEVGPGDTKTFTVTLTAPTTPGTYTTDWRMLREGVTWFGDTCQVTINVFASGAPVITSQPQPRTVNPGTTATFSASASGNGTLYYQWRRDGTNLVEGGKFVGVHTGSLTITNVQQSESGNYSMAATNSLGFAESQSAALAVNAVIVFQDTFESGNLNNWAVQSGTSALDISTAQNHTSGGSRSAYLDNSLDKMYHNLGAEISRHSRATWWVYDGTQTRSYGEVRGFTGAGYPGTLEQLLAIGKYSSVTMSGEAFDGTKYQGRVVYGANTGWFNLDGAGAPSRTGGWHKFEIERLDNGTTINFFVDGVLCRQITGATDATWDSVGIGSVGAGSTTGDSWLDDIKVEYYDPPIILTSPASLAVEAGDPGVFTVSAQGNLLTYQWQLNGVNVVNGPGISGATSGTLTLANVQQAQAGSYAVTVSNGAGAVASATATLSVLQPPPIIASVEETGDQITISWTSVSGKTYRVQYKASFTDPTWTDLPGDVTAAGSTASKTDSISETRRFYRVVRLN